MSCEQRGTWCGANCNGDTNKITAPAGLLDHDFKANISKHSRKRHGEVNAWLEGKKMNTLNKFAWTVFVDLTFICWFMHLHVEWTQATMHYLGLLVDFSWVLVRLKCLKGSYDAFLKIIILGFNVQKHIIFQILYIIVGPLYPARALRVRRLIRILGPSQSFFPFYQNSLYRALWNQIYYFPNFV